jgi:hypothetical protein
VASEQVERKLAAILAGDVAGYSRLTGADEEGTIRRLGALRARHCQTNRRSSGLDAISLEPNGDQAMTARHSARAVERFCL